MTTDIELVERSRRRDADAFGALVTRHQQLVFGVALARCHDPALAEDVAQEAFVAAWRDLDRLRDADRVGSWVAGIARNLAANAVRTRTRRERTPLDPPLDAPSPEAAALEREDRELLHRALADLPDAHRETLVLYYLEGQSIAQIAGALALTEDVVKQRLSRGRRGLRENVATRVETVLGRTRLRPAFGAGVIAALSIARTPKASAGKLVMFMTTKKLALVAAALAVAGGAMWIATRTHDSASASTHAVNGRPPSHVARLADKAARDQLVAAIHDAKTHRAAIAAASAPALPPSSPPSSSSSSSSSGTPAPALPGGEMDKDFIRAAVHDLIPMLTECYERGLLRDPKLTGDVIVDFTIEGEPDVGGVITESAVDGENSSLADPDVRECIEQTMYSIKIDPPAHGGTVKVRYPFAFRPTSP